MELHEASKPSLQLSDEAGEENGVCEIALSARASASPRYCEVERMQTLASEDLFAFSHRYYVPSTASPMTPRKSSAALDGSIKCPSSPYKIELPPTPEATPCRSLKRPSSDSLNVEEPAKVTLKRIDFGVRRSPHSVFDSRKVPEFSILSKRRPSAPCKLSAIELKRVAESILRQVNWVDVAADAASNRGAVAYRKAVKQIMQEQVEQLLRMEADDEVPLEST